MTCNITVSCDKRVVEIVEKGPQGPQGNASDLTNYYTKAEVEQLIAEAIGGGGQVPENAVTFNGNPILFNGDYVVYSN